MFSGSVLFVFSFACFVLGGGVHSFQRIKKRTQQEPKMQKETPQFIQLAQLCSQIVFLFWGVGFKNANDAICDETTIKMWFQSTSKQPKVTETCQHLSQNLVQA